MMRTSKSATVTRVVCGQIVLSLALLPSIFGRMARAQNVASETESSQIATRRLLGVVRVGASVPLGTRIEPLSEKQKWGLFAKTTFDPGVLGVGVVGAAIDVQASAQPAYGGGTAALAQKVGAVTAQYATTNLFAKAIFSSFFHQDPRFFRKVDGTKRARFFYGLTRPAITRGDNGLSMLNTSLLVGTAMSVAVSNAYYPDRNRNAKDSAARFGLSLSVSCVADVFQEFWRRRH